jgi:hypothetical protein
MSDTIRELIITEFTTRAAVIVNTASPPAYATNIGANVLRARANVGPGDRPCCIVWPQTEEAENIHGMLRCKMQIRVEGIVAFGSTDHSVMAERILGDLKKCFLSQSWDRRRIAASPASPVTYLDPYAESIVYQGGGVDVTLEEGSISVGASARFLVTYYTKIGDPCSQ